MSIKKKKKKGKPLLAKCKNFNWCLLKIINFEPTFPQYFPIERLQNIGACLGMPSGPASGKPGLPSAIPGGVKFWALSLGSNVQTISAQLD